MPAIEVSEATEVTDELVDAFKRLIPQLSSSSTPPSRQALADLIAAPSVTLLVATLTDSGRIVGTLSLVMFPIPTGFRAWIEDVVVDEEARGAGVGEALTAQAIRRATDAGAQTLDLTSRPSRQAANRLYMRMGFVARQTNVYRLDIRID